MITSDRVDTDTHLNFHNARRHVIDCSELFTENDIPAQFNHVELFLMEDICRQLAKGELCMAWQALKEPPTDSDYEACMDICKKLALNIPNPRYYHFFFKALSSYRKIALAERMAAFFKIQLTAHLQQCQQSLDAIAPVELPSI